MFALLFNISYIYFYFWSDFFHLLFIIIIFYYCWIFNNNKLEDLKVLRRSPDLLNNVKIGQSQPQLIMEQILFYHIWGLQPFWSSDLNQGSHRNSKTQFNDFSMIFHDQQCNFHDYLIHCIEPPLLAACLPLWA